MLLLFYTHLVPIHDHFKLNVLPVFQSHLSMSVHSITLRLLLMEESRNVRGGYSHMLLVGVEVGLLAVLGGGVKLRPQVLELLHQDGHQY